MTAMSAARALACVAVASLQLAGAFYLPGVVPKQFLAGEKVPVKVNSLTSIRTHLPYDYYKLPFCKVSASPSSPLAATPAARRRTPSLRIAPTDAPTGGRRAGQRHQAVLPLLN